MMSSFRGRTAGATARVDLVGREIHADRDLFPRVEARANRLELRTIGIEDDPAGGTLFWFTVEDHKAAAEPEGQFALGQDKPDQQGL